MHAGMHANATDAAAHHHPGGGFRNPWPGEEPHGIADLLRWRRDRRRHPPPPDDATERGALATPSFAHPRADPGVLGATWVGHSTVLLQIGGLNVLTDPVWGERASPVRFAGPRRQSPPGVAFDSLPPIDVVLLSHNHYDHLDAPTVRRLARRFPDAEWALPLGVGPLVRKLGVRSVHELDWWESVRVSGGRAALSCTPARHFSARGPFDRNATLWCGWAIRAGTRRAFFAGDTAWHPEFGSIAQRLGPFDLVILPVGAYEPRWFMRAVHMDPADAVRAYGEILASHPAAPRPPMLGVHWGTFRLTDEPLGQPPTRTRAEWTRGGYSSDDLWLLEPGETRFRAPGR